MENARPLIVTAARRASRRSTASLEPDRRQGRIAALDFTPKRMRLPCAVTAGWPRLRTGLMAVPPWPDLRLGRRSPPLRPS